MLNTHPTAIPFLRQQVSGYLQCAGDESWKHLHEEAMDRRDLEATLQVGNGLFRSIMRYAPEPDQGIDSEVLELMQWWVRPCENVEAHVRRFEESNCVVDGADEFREHWNHARTLLAKLPTTWRGQRIYSEAELKAIDFPFPPEPE